MTVEELIAAGVNPTQAKAFVQPLLEAMTRFDITTHPRRCAFISQLMHESSAFTRLEESLWYTTADRIRLVFRLPVDVAQGYVKSPQRLANRVYANRLGNGPESSGDGWKFRGRGLIQLTGRDNYTRASKALGVFYDVSPESVCLPKHAALTAAWFWHLYGCNEAADRGDIDGVTRKINGPAMMGRKERADLYRHTLQALA
jgi:putative chitinase